MLMLRFLDCRVEQTFHNLTIDCQTQFLDTRNRFRLTGSLAYPVQQTIVCATRLPTAPEIMVSHGAARLSAGDGCPPEPTRGGATAHHRRLQAQLPSLPGSRAWRLPVTPQATIEPHSPAGRRDCPWSARLAPVPSRPGIPSGAVPLSDGAPKLIHSPSVAKSQLENYACQGCARRKRLFSILFGTAPSMVEGHAY